MMIFDDAMLLLNGRLQDGESVTCEPFMTARTEWGLMVLIISCSFHLVGQTDRQDACL
jgi:hypothetical protein